MAKWKPCIKLLNGESSLGFASLRTLRIISKATITPAKLNPFRKKHQPSPIRAIAKPAIAGPTTRAPLKIEELSAIALGRSSFPTICTKKRLADRHVKRIHDANEKGNDDHFPDADQMRQLQCRQHERKNHRGHLRGNHAALPVVAVPNVPADRGKKQHWQLARKSEDTQERRRSSHLIDQPELRGRLHPRPNQRNELPCNEQLEVAMLHGAKARGHGGVDRFRSEEHTSE